MRTRRRRVLNVLLLLVLLVPAAGIAGLKAWRYPHYGLVQTAEHVTSALWFRLFTRTPYDAREAPARELRNVRGMLQAMEPRLANAARAGALHTALLLRDMVYRRVPVRRPPPGLDFTNLDRATYLSLRDPEVGHLCRGLVLTYLTVLKAFGIPARFVGIYAQATDASYPVTSHASVDVWIHDRWVAMDPTFNFSIHDAHGRRIGWADAYAAVHAARTISFDSDGFETLPGRSLPEYTQGERSRFTSTMNFITLGPSARGGRRTERRFLPADWDGTIGYRSSRRDDVAVFGRGSVFDLLARPVPAAATSGL